MRRRMNFYKSYKMAPFRKLHVSGIWFLGGVAKNSKRIKDQKILVWKKSSSSIITVSGCLLRIRNFVHFVCERQLKLLSLHEALAATGTWQKIANIFHEWWILRLNSIKLIKLNLACIPEVLWLLAWPDLLFPVKYLQILKYKYYQQAHYLNNTTALQWCGWT